MARTISDPVPVIQAQINDALDHLGVNQQWLGNEVASIEGRKSPYSQPSVHGWIQRPDNLEPRRLFDIEKALKLAPGSLSRLLGYVPADLAPATSVVDAIRADTALSAHEREFLIDAYRAAKRRRKNV